MQSRLRSLAESIAHTTTGFIVAWALTILLAPVVLGTRIDAQTSFLWTMIFTASSVGRGYFLRRMFLRWK